MRVELDETMFRLIAPDESASELAVYGTAAMLEYEGVKYYCHIADANDTPRVFRIDQETEIEAGSEEVEFETDFDVDEEGEDEAGEDEELEEVEE